MPDAAALPRLTLRILVTGGSGVLGRATIPVLRSAGHRVGAPASSALDLIDPAALGPAVAAVDAVLHLATRIPAPADMERPEVPRRLRAKAVVLGQAPGPPTRARCRRSARPCTRRTRGARAPPPSPRPSGIYNVCRDGERVSNERLKRGDAVAARR